MQKYINIAFVMALLALGFYIVRLQVFNEVQSVQIELNRQSQDIQGLRADVVTITNFLNQQLQAQQPNEGPSQ